MNPLIQRQLSALEKRIAEAKELLEEVTRERTSLLKEREKLLQEQWRLRKQLTTYQRSFDDYETQRTQLQRLDERHKLIRKKLREVLDKVKTLNQELRP